MPRSKKNKVVNLTKVKKKGRAAKDDLISTVQEALDAYSNSYVVSFENMRAGPFKYLQKESREHSKFFLGKNKVMSVACGRSPEEEHADNSHLLTKYLHGQVCLMLSNLDTKGVEECFKKAEVEDYAIAGMPATYTIHLAKGVKALDGFGHAMEPHLR